MAYELQKPQTPILRGDGAPIAPLTVASQVIDDSNEQNQRMDKTIQLLSQGKSVRVYKCTFLKDNWVQNEDFYWQQIVPCEAITENTLLSPPSVALTGNKEQDELILENLNYLKYGETLQDQIKYICYDDKPTIDLTLYFQSLDTYESNTKNGPILSINCLAPNPQGQITLEARDVGAVKTINGKEGESVELVPSDIGAAAEGNGINIYIYSKEGTTHNFQGTGPNGRALMTANVEEGDTFAVNGTPVTAWMGTDEAVGSMAGSEYNGRWVSFIVDGETLNFKGGNGLSVADKAKLIPANISYGVNLFEGTPREVRGDLSLELVKEGTVYISWDGTRGATAVAEWEADRDSRVLLFIGHNGDLQHFTGPTIAASINGSATSADNFFPTSSMSIAYKYRSISLYDLKKGDTIKGSIYMYTKTSSANLYVRVYRL